MKLILSCVAVLICSGFAFGQAPALNPEQKVELYAIQHKLDGVQKQEQLVQTQFIQTQTEAKAKYDGLQAQEKKLQADLDAKVDEAMKSAKADPNTFEMDREEWTIKAKPTKAEAKPPMTVIPAQSK
jgi:hypothetical protein